MISEQNTKRLNNFGHQLLIRAQDGAVLGCVE
jgi:hypothetical protein